IADQLGLVLDAAELLARTVAVERSLAHAEKLAAIGELAARIAHEIRNPVTAARSLAQQLAREPTSPFAAEHRLILGELERVERQVAALLRFARREDFRFEPVDLAELARATLEAFRPRLEAGGVTLELALADGVTARADREKLRQVLVNLLENALDAMTAEAGGPRTLSVAVGNGHGAAALEVRDSGPGVPADALSHLGEPFFSTKPSGTGLGLTRDLTLLGTLAVGRHAIRLMPVPERPPTRAWLAANYGPPASAGLGLTLARVLLGPAGAPGESFARFCGLTFGVLCLREGWKTARPGAWGPEGAVENRRPDVALVAGGLLVSAVVFLALAAAGHTPLGLVLLDVGVALAIAAPWALRVLGVVIPDVLVTATLLAAAGGVIVAHTALAARLDPHDLPLLHFATALALALVFMPGQAWLRAAINRLVLRRSRQQQAALQAFLHTLSPELGTLECCRRALAELVRVRGVPGAAIILADGEAIAHGEFDLAPLVQVWPRGAAADALPARSFGSIELRALPLALREALVRARVTLGAAPILSPRRRWGHLFMNTGMLGGVFREDDFEEFQAFVAQLALLLDGADLLARALAVERSLAHAEKLAALGEL